MANTRNLKVHTKVRRLSLTSGGIPGGNRNPAKEGVLFKMPNPPKGRDVTKAPTKSKVTKSARRL